MGLFFAILGAGVACYRALDLPPKVMDRPRRNQCLQACRCVLAPGLGHGLGGQS